MVLQLWYTRGIWEHDIGNVEGVHPACHQNRGFGRPLLNSPCSQSRPASTWPSEMPKQWTLHCLYCLCWDIGPCFLVLLEVRVPGNSACFPKVKGRRDLFYGYFGGPVMAADALTLESTAETLGSSTSSRKRLGRCPAIASCCFFESEGPDAFLPSFLMIVLVTTTIIIIRILIAIKESRSRVSGLLGNMPGRL